MAEHEDPEIEPSPNDSKTATRRRPSTGFPVVSLADAALILKEAGKYGFEHSLGEFASYRGHTSTNGGAFRQQLAAMRDWKLIAGRGDNISMTDVARVIALPPDDETEHDALRSAFKNCAIFYKLFEDMQKGIPLARQGLGNQAVHAFGVSPSSVNKFVASFVDSAVAAGIAQVDDNGQVTLLDPTADFLSGADVGQESPAPPAPTSVTARAAQSGRSATPVVHQAWPIDGGMIIFEIRSERPLPASAYATVGEVVASLERLSVTPRRVEHCVTRRPVEGCRPEGRHCRGVVGQSDEVIFEVRWQHDGKLLAAGSYAERADAEARLAELNAMRNARGVTEPRYWIEEIDTSGLFELPSRPTPRERFTTRVDTNKAPGTWTTCHVEVLEGERVVGSYDRNYAMLQTFEPFRQGDRIFALIAPDYTATSVMDLQTGEVVASEEPNSFGFCPVGFYVPDWWDVNDGSVRPGSLHWSEDKEWPSGDFGFVWGCVWGDDSSWKVQYLDLSGVSGGRIRRDERFGYVKLASSPDRPAKEFIRCWRWQGRDGVEFTVPTMFDLTSGAQIQTDDFNDDE